MVTMQSILNNLTGYNILNSTFKQDVDINSATIIQPNISYLDGVIYICKQSYFYDINPANENAVFFIVNDVDDINKLNAYNNVVLMGAETDLAKLYSDIMVQVQIAYRICKANVIVSKCVYERYDINNILQIAADFLGNPIFLQDSSTRLLDNSDISNLSLDGDEIIKNILNNGYVSADLFEKYDYEKLLNLIEQQPESFVIESPCTEKVSRIIVRLKVSNKYFGWIVLPSVNKPFQKGDLEIMNILSSAMAIVLENSNIISAATCHGNLFLEMLTENIRSESEFKIRSSGFGWNLKDKYFLLTVAHKQHNANDEHDYHSMIMLAHKNQLHLLLPDVKCVIYESKLIMLIETDDSSRFENRIFKYLESNKLIGSLSMFFTSILELKSHYKLTSDILALGIKLKKPDIVFHYHDMYVYQIILELKELMPLKNYCLSEIIEMMRYDYTYNTNYLQTIKEYLSTRNIVATADKLNIHRNTMQYRVKKFTELTGLNLDCGDDIFKVWLSFKILDTFPDDF